MAVVGIGADLIEVGRVAGAVARFGESFLQRIYTAHEREYSRVHGDFHAHLALRFAAKEAVMKALGTGWDRGIRWQDIEMVRAEGKPNIVLYGRAKQLAEELGVTDVHITATHSQDLAFCQVLLEHNLEKTGEKKG
jgi:holo-[acyl-carrier protein] synthase